MKHPSAGAAALALAAAISGAPQAAGADECDAIRSGIERLDWRSPARGLDLATIELRSEHLRDLAVIRYANGVYRARAFDLRDVIVSSHSKGFYAPPLFSIGELQRNLPRAAFIASAGLTKSFTEPVPAGFLRINGATKVSVAPRDRVLDGVVCMSREGDISILSEGEGAGRRAPDNVDRCHSGFQAGPVLMSDGVAVTSQPKQHALQVSRVVLAQAHGDSTVLFYSSSATIAALRCAVSARQFQVVSAINLQGDTLGGVALGMAIASGAHFGNINATVASALVVEPRPAAGLRSR